MDRRANDMDQEMEDEIEDDDNQRLAQLAVIDDEAQDSEADDDGVIENREQHIVNQPTGTNEGEVQYEISRSSKHEYLGATEELSGRTVIEENDLVTIPVLMPSASMNLVLLPSQTLPLTIFQPIQQSMIRNVIAKDRIIGIVHTQIAFNGTSELVHFGTTAEIFEYHNDESGTSVSVKAKGRQRFRIISTHRETTGCVVAKVKILPEIRMSDPLWHIRPLTHQVMNLSNACSDAGQTLQVRKTDCVRSVRAWKARHRSAMLTPWPSWVYDLYDDDQLAVRLVNEIVTCFKFQSNIEIPRDPQELSHWASVNLPLSDSNRLSLLALNSATQRLRYMLSVTSQTIKKRLLHCDYCKRRIANTKDIFCMSTDGPQGTFVNPDGYVHEMITVTHAVGLSFVGEASIRHSWFPGYAWKIACCKTCQSHIGWMFKASKSKMKPDVFYGLTRKSVRTVKSDESIPHHYVI